MTGSSPPTSIGDSTVPQQYQGDVTDHTDMPAHLLRAAVRDIALLAAERAEREAAIARELETETADARQEYEHTIELIEAEYGQRREQIEQEYQRATTQLTEKHDQDRKKAEYTRALRLRQITEDAEERVISLKKAWQEEVWLTESVYEAAEPEPNRWYEVKKAEFDEQLKLVEKVGQDALATIARYKQNPPEVLDQPELDAPAQDEPGDATDEAPDAEVAEKETRRARNRAASEASARLDSALAQARDRLNQLNILRSGRLIDSALLPTAMFVLVAGLVAFTAWLTNWKITYWLAVAALSGGVVDLVAYVLLLRRVGRQVIDIYIPLTQRMSAGRKAYADCMKLAQVERDRQKAELLHTRNLGLAAAKARYEPRIAQTKQKRKDLLAEVTAQSRAELDHIEQDFTEGMTLAKQTCENDTETNERTHVEARAAADKRLKDRTSHSQRNYDTQWASLSQRWLTGGGQAVTVMSRAVEDDRSRFGQWTDADYWNTWEPVSGFSPIIRFGRTRIDFTKIAHAIPKDPRLRLESPDSFDIPAVATFPDQCSVLLQAGGEGRDMALQALRSFMLRLLTLLPPGKVRFTILDPVGLGQSFAGFMHLADYDEALVGSRIWTEQRHIEQRLLDLTEHMEIVIQKYLRNEFDNIEQYNRQAGEIAEPYRFLVVADFPTNFNDASAHRLASIVASGARCGVYALVMRDVRQQLPRGLQLPDLEKRMINLVHDPGLGRFVWKDDVYEPYPVTLDPAPDDDFLTSVLHKVGKAATDASRVEVPFTTIAPKTPAEHWSYDSSRGVRIPLGRAGATKLQYIDIGQGTSQHVLIAGKTGSGKSTLLHAMITSAGLWYHPDQLQMYLVDFKKGVEFKTYALNNMPHAVAVAIESDREFGLSVLHKLDAELKHRGQMFRQANVQDVPGFRVACPDVTMPRLLLIIDEFQEFFTEDDKLAQDASLLLDRLVRQGRAFGIHVILGSQTLGGAYSLARSTIGQMAIRIALQCSEQDSYLILSDDNAAARLLSRPGEAIYNASSGSVEGNSPFQIAWLPDKQRDMYLSDMRVRCAEAGYERPETQIVFEGNLPGDIRRNTALNALLTAPTWPDSPPDRPVVWLGEPIAIKDPTHAELRRMSGQNLIIVGQRDDPCLAMMSIALIGLSAQYPGPGPDHNTGPRFVVLDGILDDDPRAGYLARVCAALPHRTEIVNWRDIPDRFNEISRLIDARQSDTNGRSGATEPVFIIVHGLQRFRLLKKQEDDYSYSFSSSEESRPAAGPDKQFDRILRDGPAAGVHVLMWCDTVTNLTRMLDRNVLREIEMRVLFQMSINDSSHLMDSPEASRIGLRRALYFCEELGQLEKFRPYGLPDDEWLARVAACFGRKQQDAQEP